jgi:hypothetical protein
LRGYNSFQAAVETPPGFDTIGDSITKQGLLRLDPGLTCSVHAQVNNNLLRPLHLPTKTAIVDVLSRAQRYQPLDFFLGEKCRLAPVTLRLRD